VAPIAPRPVTAREPKTPWEIPVGGMEARPAEYERRVAGFFDDELR
jgi:hypothetical protein